MTPKARAVPVPIHNEYGHLQYYRVASPYPYPHYTGYYLTLEAAQAAADRINAMHGGTQ